MFRKYFGGRFVHVYMHMRNTHIDEQKNGSKKYFWGIIRAEGTRSLRAPQVRAHQMDG